MNTDNLDNILLTPVPEALSEPVEPQPMSADHWDNDCADYLLTHPGKTTGEVSAKLRADMVDLLEWQEMREDKTVSMGANPWVTYCLAKVGLTLLENLSANGITAAMLEEPECHQ